jgi:hypothetical protein
MDEVQDINPSVFTEVVRPALSDTVGSRALFTGTPKGRVNFLYHLSEMRHKDEEWSFHNFPTSANPCIPRSEIKKAKDTLPPRIYKQEYEADFVNFAGQIYTELDTSNLTEIHEEIPHLDLVVLGVDFGDRHPAIVAVGREPRSGVWYLLDSWSPNTAGGESQPVTRETFQDKVVYMVDKWNADLIFCDPSRPSEILAIRKYGDKKVYKSAVAAFNGIQSGIGQVHSLIHQNKLKMRKVDSSLTDHYQGQILYDYLSSYVWELDKHGNVTEVPADGNVSHINDALRYALAVRGA